MDTMTTASGLDVGKRQTEGNKKLERPWSQVVEDPKCQAEAVGFSLEANKEPLNVVEAPGT